MIITKINGGLGNQMFQYATGRALALRRNTILKVDPTSHQGDTPRTFELPHFCITAEIATPEEVTTLKTLTGSSLFQRIKRHLPLKKTHVFEKHFQFDPGILELGDNTYLEGFWQSEKYFLDAADTIRQELVLKEKPDTTNAATLQEIAATPAVALHIRRGDYVSNPETNKHHGTCSLDYYQAGVEHIASQVTTPHFFIFSDDPQWAKDNLNLKYPTTLIDHNDAAHGYEDMRLMSACQHFIIANSTFSWWGAWLAANPGKIVVAPKQWFATTDVDTRDLVPTNWVRL
jgi:hypothetical protein